MSKDYIIAGFRIRIEGRYCNLHDLGLRGFRPFEAEEEPDADYVMRLDPECELGPAPVVFELIHSFEFPDARHNCTLKRAENAWIFGMRPYGYDKDDRDTIFVMPFGSREVRSNIASGKKPDPSLLRFGLWLMFGLAINPLGAIAVHSSVIVKNKRAVMFLGESGTGKSTHTRLWRENIVNSTLLNDDSPIVRCVEGVPYVFGSAWSGKTPCYVNRGFPIRAIVRLSQAPHNKIRKLSVLEALAALLPSCPPAFSLDSDLQDNIFAAIAEILKSVPVYHLECLPDAEAARLAHRTLYVEPQR